MRGKYGVLAKKEVRFCTGGQVWTATYKNLHNIPHWHMEHELAVCLTGSARIFLGGSVYNIGSGQCFFCQGGKVHWIDADDDCILLMCVFDEKITRTVTANFRLVSPVFEDHCGVKEQLKDIHEVRTQRQIFHDEACRAKITLLMISIFRSEKRIESHSDEFPSSRQCMQLLEKIDQEYEFITFEDAARFMNFSGSYFSCYFKQYTGITFSKYLSSVRVEKALELIHQNPQITVAEAARRSGFNSVRSFDRSVKELTGFPPKKLPKDCQLNLLTIHSAQEVFDPTLQVSELL